MTVTDSQGTIIRGYDELNRVTNYTDANENTISYTYDSAEGNIATITYPGNKTVTYTYNKNNQLSNVVDWEGRNTAYNYDNNGRLSSMARPDGSIEVYSYDLQGRITSITDKYSNGNTINCFNYGYDADGNIISETSINRADSIVIPDANMAYTTANRLNTYNGVTVGYDNDGNALSTPMGSIWGDLSYDTFNNLTAVDYGEDTIALYTYDAEGARVKKIEDGDVTRYVVDKNSALSRVLMATTNGNTTYYIYGIGLIGQEDSTGYKAYHHDIRGSTVAITDISGTVTDRVYYDPYGSIVERTGNTKTPFLYVGEYGVETDDCGLYYMRARYYNPVIKRFVNEDPIRDGYNWYAYCGGNPINRIDPTGEIAPIIIYGLTVYATMLVNSPDFYYDAQLVSMDYANGDWFALAGDLVGMAIPGATGLGSVTKQAFPKAAKFGDDAVRFISRFGDDAARAVTKVGDDALKQIARAGNYVKAGVKSGFDTLGAKIAGTKLYKGIEQGYDIYNSIKRGIGAVGNVLADTTGSLNLGGSNIGRWNKGSFDLAESSLEYHFNKHGAEVGANSPIEYLRKAEGFAQNAKKGSTKSKVSGAVEGTTRYKKNGKYIDIAPDGTIVSFGKQ